MDFLVERWGVTVVDRGMSAPEAVRPSEGVMAGAGGVVMAQDVTESIRPEPVPGPDERGRQEDRRRNAMASQNGVRVAVVVVPAIVKCDHAVAAVVIPAPALPEIEELGEGKDIE